MENLGRLGFPIPFIIFATSASLALVLDLWKQPEVQEFARQLFQNSNITVNLIPTVLALGGLCKSSNLYLTM